jgi:hypothetical protein
MGVGVVEEEGETGGGIARIEWDVGGAGAEDGEEGDDEVWSAWEAEGDADVGSGAESEEEAGEAGGAEEEVVVGEGEVRRADGGSVGSAQGLADDQVIDPPDRGGPD